MDQRDQAVDQLSQLMDIRVSSTGNNQTSVYTSTGVELVGASWPRRSRSIRRAR